MKTKHAGYTALPYPRVRMLMVDGGWMGRQKHTIHGLVEFDVTLPRQVLREFKERTGETLSFTAFLLACLGRAVEMNKHMHAYRDWRNQLILFDDVDINTLFEVDVDGRKLIRPHVLRAVNQKTFRALHEEIRAFQAGHTDSAEGKFVGWFTLLPGWIRRIILQAMSKNAFFQKEYMGTVILTSIGMFGSGGGWGIPVTNHTLQVTLGGIAEKPGAVGGRIEIREYLSVTISIDHDIIDGAPAARFIQRLKDLVESGYGLVDDPSIKDV